MANPVHSPPSECEHTVQSCSTARTATSDYAFRKVLNKLGFADGVDLCNHVVALVFISWGFRSHTPNEKYAVHQKEKKGSTKLEWHAPRPLEEIHDEFVSSLHSCCLDHGPRPRLPFQMAPLMLEIPVGVPSSAYLPFRSLREYSNPGGKRCCTALVKSDVKLLPLN